MFGLRRIRPSGLCLVIAGLLFHSTSSAASGSYSVTVEGKLLIQPSVVGGTFDTINFDQPTILLTTKRGLDGVAYAYQLATSPLRITDTIVADSSSDILRAIAASLDGHPDPDYLVAAGSVVRVIYSEAGGHEKLISIPGKAMCLATRPADGRVCIGYARDTAWMDQWWDHYNYSAGGLLDFASADAPGIEILPLRWALDLRWLDFDADGQAELVTLWHSHSSVLENAPGSPHLLDSRYWAYGYSAIGADSNSGLATKLATLSVRGGGSYGHLFFAGALLLDLGSAHGGWTTFTAASSSGWIVNSGSFSSASLTARRAHGDSLVWSHTGTYGRPFAWDLNYDGSPELLVAHALPTQPPVNLFLNPHTGDSLGVIESEYPLNPWASALYPDGGWRGVLMRGDTLILFSISLAGWVNSPDRVLPDDIVIKGNYPNPFNAGTIIAFYVKSPSPFEVVVHDLLGRAVARLSPGTSAAGHYHAAWDGRLEGGSPAPSGVYFYRVTQGTVSAAGRMILLR